MPTPDPTAEPTTLVVEKICMCRWTNAKINTKKNNKNILLRLNKNDIIEVFSLD
jgi:hypothetical protein